MEKQLQQQLGQMTNLQKQLQQSNSQNGNNAEVAKEMEQLRKELQSANVERNRFQSQLEMLVQELEKSQVSLLIKILYKCLLI